MRHTNFPTLHGTPYVCLNDNEQNVRLSLCLTPQGVYGTLISDSCRGFEPLQLKESFSAKTADDLVLSAENIGKLKTLHKEMWFELLEKKGDSSHGVITMYSCSSGQSADEDPKSGGLYTTLLINSSKNWYSEMKSNSSHLSTLDAYINVKELMKTYTPQQTPEYVGYPVQFPFAVKTSQRRNVLWQTTNFS